MSEKQFTIVGLGEVLWDIFPSSEKMLGGAPANFAYIATKLGDRGILASRVGDDSDGTEIIERLQNTGLDTSNVQIDPNYSTGMVQVRIQDGQPAYEIPEPIAWDFLELTANWHDLALKCDALCFGSLAQRNPVSRQTIREFVGATRTDCLRIFDVNLRQRFFSYEVLSDSLTLANAAKLNHEELILISELLDVSGENETEQAQNLKNKFDLRFICVTQGERGSMLFAENEMSQHKGIRVETADTVGAGDAFTAAMTRGFLHGLNLDEINREANRVAAFVASRPGAMPDF